MSTDLRERLSEAYTLREPAGVEGDGHVVAWRRGRRQRAARRTVAAAAVIVALGGVGSVVTGLAPSPASVYVGEDATADAPRAPLNRNAGWNSYGPGEVDVTDITSTVAENEVVLSVPAPPKVADATGTVTFDVGQDGTVAIFDPYSGDLRVQTADGTDRRFDTLRFLVEEFPPSESRFWLRVGRDGRIYVTASWDHVDADPSSASRVTVVDINGELLGSKSIPYTNHPVVFDERGAWVSVDAPNLGGPWRRIAAPGGALVGGPDGDGPPLANFSGMDYQGNFLEQVAGRPLNMTMYTLEHAGDRWGWLLSNQGVMGWASRPPEERGPRIVIANYDDGRAMVLVARPGSLLAAWADDEAAGLRGIGDHSARAVEEDDGDVVVYWLEQRDGRTHLVRGTARR